MPRTIVPARDITHNQLFLSPNNEGNVICIRLKNHYKEWEIGMHGQHKECGPYLMVASHDYWSYSFEGYTPVEGHANSLDDAKKQCEASVLLAVLGCLEFVD